MAERQLGAAPFDPTDTATKGYVDALVTSSSNSFAATIGNGTPALIDAYSNWCGPCLAAKPAVDALERDLRGRVNVVRVDVEAPSAALVQRRYGLRGTPTYVLVDGAGNERWRQVGGSPDRGAIERTLAQLRP